MKHVITIVLVLLSVLLNCLSADAQSWKQLGPFSFPANSKQIGKVNCVAFHPVNPNVLYVGTPAGGVFWSTNGGSVWQSLVDTIQLQSISDIVINPTDSASIALALGDDQYGLRNTLGSIYSTSNYGSTWTRSSGRPSATPNTNNRVLVNASSPLNMTIASSEGIYTTSDAGATLISRSSLKPVVDLVMRPNDFSVQIASINRNGIYRSANGGTSWTSVSSTFPSTFSRAALATSAANANIVYAACCDFSGAFLGLYRSQDAGQTWTLMSSSPNIFSASMAGTGTTGSGNQTLSMVVSPTNANTLYVGSKNIWKSTDGGATWTIVSHFTNTNNQFVAADIHRLAISNIGGIQRVYACTGGGLFSSRDAGATWENLSSNLQNAMVSKIVVHPQNDTLVLAATPRGLLRSTGGVAWTLVSDSVATDVSMRPNGGTVYMQTNNGYLMRSNDSGQTFPTNMSPSEVVLGSATIPYTFNPLNDRTIYASLRDLWKTSNGGTTWTKQLNPLGSLVRQIVILNSDTNTLIAVTANNRLWRSLNGGAEWRDITHSTTPLSIDRIIINPKNNDQMIALCTAVNTTTSIYLSINGGSSWTGVPLPVPLSNGENMIAFDCFFKTDNCDESLIMATPQGMFMRPIDTQSSWTAMGMQFPIPVFSVSRNGRKLYAGTGRGIWTADMTNIGVVPDFASDKSTVCPGETIQFYDRSLFGPIDWRWEFEGGRPSTTDETNPTIQYLTAGTFNVKLIVKNTCGKDSIIRKAITVNPLLRATIQVQRENFCTTDTILVTDATPGIGGTRNWSVNGATYTQRTPTIIALVPSGEGKISLGLSVNNVCGSTTASKDIFTFNPPSRPTIVNKNDTLSVTDSAGLRYQWYLEVNAVAGATTYILNPKVNGRYYVTVTNQGGCLVRSDTVLYVKTDVSVVDNGAIESLRLYPTPSGSFVKVAIPSDFNNTELTIRIYSLLGETVYAQQVQATSEMNIPLQGIASGHYILRVDNAHLHATTILIKE